MPFWMCTHTLIEIGLCWFEAGVPCKHIVSVPRHEGFLMDKVNDDIDKEPDGMAADFAMQMTEVRITKQVERLSESVQKVNEQLSYFEYILRLYSKSTGEQRIDLVPGEDYLVSAGGREEVTIMSLPNIPVCSMR